MARDSGRSSRADWVMLAAAACLLVAVSFACRAPSSSAATAPSPQTLTLYSTATAEQFVNNEDDRARGAGNNPFGTYNDFTSSTQERGAGPFPGDEAIFTFDLYTEPKLYTKAGTAVLTCQYGFNKNAFCDASYRLAHGTLFGAGAFNFSATGFSLAITGGYGTYTGVIGDVETTPSINHAQRLRFVIQSAG
jgi:hypothetical protein